MSVKKGGTIQLGPYNFDADTFQTFTLGLNWQGTYHPHDWSVTVYGQSGDVFVYNLDGSKTMEWGKSRSMAKLGPKSKPASWAPAGKTELTIPNRQKEPTKTVVRANRTPAAPQQHPEKNFVRWSKALPNDENVPDMAIGMVEKGQYMFHFYENRSTVE